LPKFTRPVGSVWWSILIISAAIDLFPLEDELGFMNGSYRFCFDSRFFRHLAAAKCRHASLSYWPPYILHAFASTARRCSLIILRLEKGLYSSSELDIYRSDKRKDLAMVFDYPNILNIVVEPNTKRNRPKMFSLSFYYDWKSINERKSLQRWWRLETGVRI